MNMRSVFTNSPRIRRSKTTFFKWEPLGSTIRQRIEIPHEVTWVQESTSKLVYRHGGQVLQEKFNCRDSWGYLTSLSICVGYAEEYAQHFDVGPTSSLEIVVVSTVAQHPYLENAETLAYNRGRRDDPRSMFFEVPAEWRVEHWDDGEQSWPQLLPVEVTSEVIWSSKNNHNRNTELQESFKSRVIPQPQFA